MFQEPRLFKKSDCFQVWVAATAVNALEHALREAGFPVTHLEGTVGYEDLNDECGHEEVAVLELGPTVDKLKLREFLRHRRR